jgi:alanine racemase
VIVVTKADGYGHGSIETALHLADYCGADAFAVATIEEGIALRKALDSGTSSSFGTSYSASASASVSTGTSANHNHTYTGIGSGIGIGNAHTNASTNVNTSTWNGSGNNSVVMNSSFFTSPFHKQNQQQVPSSIDIQSQSDVSSIHINHTSTLTNSATHTQPYSTATTSTKTKKRIRSNNIRIIVLGPPTNIPSDFNLYLHYNIEVMISSPTMARNLMIWVADCDGRKRAEVEKVANERKKELMRMMTTTATTTTTTAMTQMAISNNNNYQHDENCNPLGNNCGGGSGGGIGVGNDIMGGSNGINGSGGGSSSFIKKNTTTGQSATLTSVQGNALSKEVRAFLKAKDEAAAAAAVAATANTNILSSDNANSIVTNTNVGMNNTHIESRRNSQQSIHSTNSNTNVNHNNVNNNVPFAFKGIEDIAKESRRRELAAAKLMAHFTGENDIDDVDDDDDHVDDHNNMNIHSAQHKQQQQNNSDNDSLCNSKISSNPSSFIFNEDAALLDDGKLVSTVSTAIAKKAINASTAAAAKMNNSINNNIPSTMIPIHTTARKKLRWHALIDSGMGRLGFKSTIDDGDEVNDDQIDEKKSDNQSILLAGSQIGPNGEKIVEKWKIGPHKDTVSIIKSMCHAEIDGAPIEFHGICTHMAEASSNSNYTNEQMTRFKSLLKSVRQAGISVPTISTDNSSALLTTSLTHFNPVELLSQPNSDTRGYVRTGGAIYGQRPAFPQLRAVSTLSASVRHVATLMKGETVGYDRAYKAEKDVRIATLSIGFADGYPRELGNGKGKVSIRGEVFPVAGNVCMDMLMVDLGCIDNLSEAGGKVCINDVAYLWGPEADVDGEGQVRLQDIANILNTTQSALTCGLDKTRVQRHYID